ncbi:hypothetical protein BASA50_006733 [Batrachochytrium salamandrivorans]|uniref:Calpain catalytic domain-containing protein n=1 Tax=Batrachochytrium salamandrivorans TaxID=1357716 RepID=A0ABQ8F8Y1_9FUNG|nr:hypothetical protein BASA50_006733 [Batrachochytrium salamandrivorans]
MSPKPLRMGKTDLAMQYSLGSGKVDSPSDDYPDTPITVWPEWSDSEVAAEKWNTKHIFEDSEGQVWLPRSLRKLVDATKRPNEMMGEGQTPIVVQPMATVDDVFNSTCPLQTSPFSVAASACPPDPVGHDVSSTANGIDPLSTSTIIAPGSLQPKQLPLISTLLGMGSDHADMYGSSVGGNASHLAESGYTGRARPHHPANVLLMAAGDEMNLGNSQQGTYQDDPTRLSVAGQANATPYSSTKRDPTMLSLSSSATVPALPLPCEVSATPTKDMLAQIPQNPDSLVGTSRLFQANKHLMSSEFMRSVIIGIHFLYEQYRLCKQAGDTPTSLVSLGNSSFSPTTAAAAAAAAAGATSPSSATSGFAPTSAVSGSGIPEEYSPWEAIYPKSKDGVPIYNASGKYIVKLFWLGAWRKITIDDRIPVDSIGKPLLIMSPQITEIWPMLLCKALMKVANTSYKECYGMSEAGDFDVLHCLRGWTPERLPVRPKGLVNLASVLFALPSRSGAVPQTVNSGSYSKESGANTALPKSANVNDRQSLASTALPRTQQVQQTIMPFIFASKICDDGHSWDVKTLSYPHRICEVRESFDVASIGGSVESVYYFRIRCYFTSGLKRQASSKDKLEESDSCDYWMSLQEVLHHFSNVTIYHFPVTFRNTKTISQISDLTKATEIPKAPSILMSSEDEREISALIVFSSFCRIRQTTTIAVPSVTIMEYSWKSSVLQSPILRICTNSCASSLLRIHPRKAYRFIVDCSTSYTLNILSRDDYILEEEGRFLTEKLGLRMREFEDTCPLQPPSTWCILFKHVVMINDPTFMGIHLYVPESMQSVTCVRVINNDTGYEIPSVFFSVLPQLYQPTKSGYTILADTRTSTIARQATRWKLRIVSNSIPQSLSDKEIVSIKPTVQDFEEPYVHNKRYTLFRFALKVKDALINNAAFQVVFSIPSVWIRLQIFDNDTEILSTRGKGTATCYSAILHHYEDMVAVKASDKSRDDKKNSIAAAAAAAAAVTAASLLQPTPKHKYIVQATIEDTDASKIALAAALAGSEVVRPSSRGTKTSGSAKKKKQTMSAGGVQVQPAAINVAGGASGVGSTGGSISNGVGSGGVTTGAAITGSGSSAAAAAAATTGMTYTSGIATGSAVGSSPVASTESDCFWKLRIISTDSASLIVSKDTEKEDRLKAIKDLWETASPGRLARARDLRDAYVHKVECGQIKPILLDIGDTAVCKPWSVLKTKSPKVVLRTDYGRDNEERSQKPSPSATSNRRGSTINGMGTSAAAVMTSTAEISLARDLPEVREQTSPVIHFKSVIEYMGDAQPPRVLKPQDIERQIQERNALLLQHEAGQSATKMARAEEREKRARQKKWLLDRIDERLKEAESWNKIDSARREAYCHRIIKETEEYNAKIKASQDAAAKAAELAAEQMAGDEPCDKKKKGKK